MEMGGSSVEVRVIMVGVGVGSEEEMGGVGAVTVMDGNGGGRSSADECDDVEAAAVAEEGTEAA